MNVGGATGASSASIAALQKQLIKDVTTMAKDAVSGASKEVLAVDQARVTADQAALLAAEAQQAMKAAAAIAQVAVAPVAEGRSDNSGATGRSTGREWLS